MSPILVSVSTRRHSKPRFKLEIPQRPGDLTRTQVRGQGSKRDGVGGYAEIRLNYELDGLWKEMGHARITLISCV